jgi:hypothetical protein
MFNTSVGAGAASSYGAIPRILKGIRIFKGQVTFLEPRERCKSFNFTFVMRTM